MIDTKKSQSRPDPAELRELREALAAVREEVDRYLGRDGKGLSAEGPDVESCAGLDGWVDRVGQDLRQRLADVDWIRLYQELGRRFVVLGVQDGSPEVDDFGFDARYLDRARVLLDFLYRRWWRVEAVGFERVPRDRPVLFVANRAGILPYDGLMICHAVERETGGQQRPRFLVADWLLRVPFWQANLARVGGVRACAENAERLLETDRWVVAFPEGQKGALKPYRDRYQLQRFARGGFVSLAVRTRSTIVPVAVVGSEEVHPILFQSRFAEQLLGMPVPVTPTFPMLGPLGLIPLPSRWRIRFGDPVGFEDVPLEQADDPLYVNRVRERIRGAIQLQLNREIKVRPAR
jgi:1-acyl-sn-glycerol-3-phosphate acyltransferase